MTTEKTIAANLKKARKDLGWSQERTANAMRERGARWHSATVARAEAGARSLPVDDLIALLDLFGPAVVDGTPLSMSDIATTTSDRAREARIAALARNLVSLTETWE